MASEIPIRLPESDRSGAQKNSRGSRVVTFSLTLPKLIFSVLFMAGVLVWVFIFGIMLGRGHKPEKLVPELARVMPVPQRQTGQPAQAAASAPARSGNQTAVQATAPGAVVAAAKPVAPSPTGVLAPQDLQYHDTLKGRPTASPVPSTAKPAPAAKTAAAKTKPTAKPDPKVAAKTDPKTAAKPDPKTDPKATAKKTAEKPVEKPADKQTTKTTEPAYNYVYQVAAFKDMPSAEALRKKLQSAGIAARIEKDTDNGTTWYKLLAPFKGRPEDTRTLRQKLSDQGIARVILRSKTQVQ